MNLRYFTRDLSVGIVFGLTLHFYWIVQKHFVNKQQQEKVNHIFNDWQFEASIDLYLFCYIARFVIARLIIWLLQFKSYIFNFRHNHVQPN